MVCLVALGAQAGTAPTATTSSYFDNTGRDDVLSVE